MIYFILVTLSAFLALTGAPVPPSPKRLCQNNDAYFPATGKCYGLNTRGPCNALMVLKASAIDGTGEGQCICKPSECSTSRDRELGYWNSTQRCYYAFDQGPCPKGEWLVPSADSSQYRCEQIPCPELYSRQEAPPKEDPAIKASNIFVFAYNGRCYTQGTQEHCPEGQKLWYRGVSGEPVCGTGFGCPYALGATGYRDCANGEARDPSGACSPEADTADYSP